MATKEWLSREEMLIGEDNIKKLERTKVLVFGVGGVGSYAVEALARAGIGSITVVDGDTVSESNINRQLIADTTTVGKEKAKTAIDRILKINPECKAKAICRFCDETNTVSVISEEAPDFIVDAIDCTPTKLIIAKYAADNGIKIISSMGTGNKLDPSQLQISDISKTSVCPLARSVRKKLKELGINHLPVLFSTEIPVKSGLPVPASISFVPSSAGLMIAGYVIRTIIGM